LPRRGDHQRRRLAIAQGGDRFEEAGGSR
jgi:hypothetical protein